MKPNDLFYHLGKLNYPDDPSMHAITLPLLGAFEDLYYATTAKVKDLSSIVEVMLRHNFKTEHDHYVSLEIEPLNALGSISVGRFQNYLSALNDLLLDEDLVQILNQGVIRKSMQDNVRKAGPLKNRKDIVGMLGHPNRLLNVEKMTSAMISAHLAEKYQFATDAELTLCDPNCEEKANGTLSAHQAEFEHASDDHYVSPYNLNERGKILNAPDRAERPCICDSDCICFGVCASDPTQDCLCEENGLFVQITEGANIDDLDIPDLIRDDRAMYVSDDESMNEGIEGEADLVDADGDEFDVGIDTNAGSEDDFEENYEVSEDGNAAQPSIQSPEPSIVFETVGNDYPYDTQAMAEYQNFANDLAGIPRQPAPSDPFDDYMFQSMPKGKGLSIWDWEDFFGPVIIEPPKLTAQETFELMKETERALRRSRKTFHTSGFTMRKLFSKKNWNGRHSGFLKNGKASKAPKVHHIYGPMTA